MIKVVQQQLNNACLRRWWSWSMVLNRHPYYTGFGLKRQDDMVWRGTAEGLAGARCSSSSPSSSSFSTSSSSLSSLDDSLS
ncbi:hypothetical protein Tco_0398025 [Tanacetum coccineum]